MIKGSAGQDVLLAEGKTVMVAFDYTIGKSIAVPEEWKAALRRFEGTAI
jgi:acyl-CoA thioesterase FadM